MRCLTSMRMRSGCDVGPLISDNGAAGPIGCGSIIVHLVHRGLLTSRHYLIFFVVENSTITVIRVLKDRMYWQSIIKKMKKINR